MSACFRLTVRATLGFPLDYAVHSGDVCVAFAPLHTSAKTNARFSRRHPGSPATPSS